MRLALATLTAVTFSLHAAVAFAQDADALNEQGIEAFAAGRYEEAAQSFAAAFDADADPIFRKSEAVAWFKAGQCEPAVEAANAFLLEWRGAPAETDEAASVVANCKVEFAEEAMEAKSFELAERMLDEAAQTARDTYTTDRISHARIALARLRREQTEASTKTGESAVAEKIAPPPPVVADAGPPVGGVVSLATGGALIAAGAIWHIVSLTQTVPRLEAEADGGDRDRHARLSQRVDVARVLVPTLYGLGFATAGLGLWFFIDRNESTERAQRRDEAVVGLSLSGRF